MWKLYLCLLLITLFDDEACFVAGVNKKVWINHSKESAYYSNLGQKHR